MLIYIIWMDNTHKLTDIHKNRSGSEAKIYDIDTEKQLHDPIKIRNGKTIMLNTIHMKL